MNKYKLRLVIISILLAVVCYVGFSIWAGWDDVTQSFSEIGLAGTLVALSLSMMNYLLRYLRWQLFLSRLGYPVPAWDSLKVYFSGFALTTTPGKAGELFRGALLRLHGVPFGKSVAAFLSERLSDLVAMVFLALLALSEFPEYRIYVIVAALLCFAAYGSLSSRRLLCAVSMGSSGRTGIIFRLFGQLASVLLDARRCHGPRLLALVTPLSTIAWGAEALALYYVLCISGSEVSLAFAVFVYSISMLAGALSFLPGGLGTAELVMVSLLTVKGILLPDAIAVTVFIRLSTLWFAVILGVFALCSFAREGEGTYEARV